MSKNDINLLRIYDIDGTITIPGNDLWYLTTRSLSSNPDKFDQHIELWKDSLRRGDCPYESSKVMMQKGIKCIDGDCKTNNIKKRAKELSKSIIENKNYYLAAISHIRKSIDTGFQIVLSTTNYNEGAEAFLEELVNHNLLSTEHQSKIFVSGSIINWETQSLLHFNMGQDKIVGISKALGIQINDLSSYVESAYGDDPQGNDAGILSVANRPFVIANKKNLEVSIPANMIRTSWENILNNHF
ncbi:hypothetical protein [Okeania sp. KiyG1]|uniref:hypothetical protein n=1 Tax=Okeania sp. KiyG1 TaxID=2720165 RepID=UPI001923653E|nr:hypothetical protein [Okeania sp. KiyG1]GGA23915.1 hypothetical protein CYANOKiyG1_39320 [Okeania sp. KiyG1]